MSLPTDVTVTISGPAFTDSQRALLTALDEYFAGIDSGYLQAAVVLPMCVPPFIPPIHPPTHQCRAQKRLLLTPASPPLPCGAVPSS